MDNVQEASEHWPYIHFMLKSDFMLPPGSRPKCYWPSINSIDCNLIVWFLFFAKSWTVEAFVRLKHGAQRTCWFALRQHAHTYSIPGFLNRKPGIEYVRYVRFVQKSRDEKQLGSSSSCRCACSLCLITSRCSQSVSFSNAAEARSLNLLTKYVTWFNKIHIYSTS